MSLCIARRKERGKTGRECKKKKKEGEKWYRYTLTSNVSTLCLSVRADVTSPPVMRYRMEVFPAASSPRNRMRASLFPIADQLPLSGLLSR